MKLKQDKCHLLVSGYKYEKIWAGIGEVKVWESSKQIDRIVIDRDLNFNENVSFLRKNPDTNLSILSRASNYLMSFRQRTLLLTSFVEVQF